MSIFHRISSMFLPPGLVSTTMSDGAIWPHVNVKSRALAWISLWLIYTLCYNAIVMMAMVTAYWPWTLSEHLYIASRMWGKATTINERTIRLILVSVIMEFIMHVSSQTTEGFIPSGPFICLSLRVSSVYAQPIIGQVTEVTCPVNGQAQPELTLSKRQNWSCLTHTTMNDDGIRATCQCRIQSLDLDLDMIDIWGLTRSRYLVHGITSPVYFYM